MSLELKSLAGAIAALDGSLALVHDEKFMSGLAPEAQETVRAGVIQHFEVAYELCWKFVQRWIRTNAAPEEADQSRTRKELFRLAARYGLVADPVAWFEFGDARNLTAHTYGEEKARIVLAQAAPLAREARDLLTKLQAHND